MSAPTAGTNARFAMPARSTVVWAVLLLAAVAWSVQASGFSQFVATNAVLAAILLLSVGVVAGDAGMASLCQVAFAAVSAWIGLQFAAAGHPLPQVLEILAAVGAAGLLGLVVGLPALRLRSVNLAVVTLGVGLAVETFLAGRNFPQGAHGESIDRPSFATDDRAFLVFSLLSFAFVALVLEVLRRRPIGGTWQSVKHSERATAAMGYSVTWAKLSAFAVGAMVAGLSGILTVMLIGVADPSTFPSVTSLVVFAVAVFIGTWRWQGALFAGAASIVIPELLKTRDLSLDWSNLVFGVGAVQALSSGSCVADGLWPRRATELTADEAALAAWMRAAATGQEQPPDAHPAVVLSVDGLSVSYGGVVAVDKVSFDVSEQEIVGLIGANGAGKTSLVDALSGYVPYDGQVRLRGVALVGGPQKRARAGLRRTFQQDRVVPALTVAGYLRLAARRHLSDDDLAVLVGFAGGVQPTALVGRLEGATRRLVEVAAACASRPEVVLLDEPVAGLSAAEALTFGARLQHAPAVFGCAVVVIEHDVDFVRAVCSRAVAVDFGAVIATGTPTEVLDSPQVRASYLGQIQEVP